MFWGQYGTRWVERTESDAWGPPDPMPKGEESTYCPQNISIIFITCLSDDFIPIIDNILTSVINGESKSRVLIDDINDHMPIIFTPPGSIAKKDTEIEDNYKRMFNTKSKVIH